MYKIIKQQLDEAKSKKFYRLICNKLTKESIKNLEGYFGGRHYFIMKRLKDVFLGSVFYLIVSPCVLTPKAVDMP